MAKMYSPDICCTNLVLLREPPELSTSSVIEAVRIVIAINKTKTMF